MYSNGTQTHVVYPAKLIITIQKQRMLLYIFARPSSQEMQKDTN